MSLTFDDIGKRVLVEEVILVIGGDNDGPGIKITPLGVTPIPPMGPKVLKALRAAAAVQRIEGRVGFDREDVAGSIMATVAGEVEQTLGDSAGILFYDGGDWDWCGTPLPGTPPIPEPIGY